MKAVGKSSWEGGGPGCPLDGQVGERVVLLGKYITYLFRGYIGVHWGIYTEVIFHLG